MRAVGDIQRLCLFPIVFSVGPVMSAALGESYGGQCSHVMSAGSALMYEQKQEASLCSISQQQYSAPRMTPLTHTVSGLSILPCQVTGFTYRSMTQDRLALPNLVMHTDVTSFKSIFFCSADILVSNLW